TGFHPAVVVPRRGAFAWRLWYRARAGKPPALPGRIARCNPSGRRSLEESAFQDTRHFDSGARLAAADAPRLLLAFHPPDQGLVSPPGRREPPGRPARHRP